MVLGARSVQKLQLIAGDIPLPGRAALLQGGRDEARGVPGLIETAVREFGGMGRRVDLQCGYFDARHFSTTWTSGVLHRLMDVNFWGAGQLLQFALPYLQASKGAVVGISSRRRAGGTAAPHGLFGFEIRHDGIPRNAAY